MTGNANWGGCKTKSAGSRLERRERGCDACVARVAMEGHPGLARSRDSVAQCPGGGEAQERRIQTAGETSMLQSSSTETAPRYRRIALGMALSALLASCDDGYGG